MRTYVFGLQAFHPRFLLKRPEHAVHIVYGGHEKGKLLVVDLTGWAEVRDHLLELVLRAVEIPRSRQRVDPDYLRQGSCESNREAPHRRGHRHSTWQSRCTLLLRN